MLARPARAPCEASGDPPPPRPGRSPFDVAGAVDDLRQILPRADALVRATEDLLERGPWGDDDDADDDDTRRLERLSHLLGAARLAHLLGVTAEAATAMVAVDKFHACVADQQSAEAGDEWNP